jgi:hypothetical protein
MPQHKPRHHNCNSLCIQTVNKTLVNAIPQRLSSSSMITMKFKMHLYVCFSSTPCKNEWHHWLIASHKHTQMHYWSHPPFHINNAHWTSETEKQLVVSKTNAFSHHSAHSTFFFSQATLYISSSHQYCKLSATVSRIFNSEFG